MQWISATDLAGSRLLHDARTLGVATHGGVAPLVCASHLPQAHLMKGVIGRDQPVVELWSGRDEAHDEIIGETHCRFNGEVLFATVSVLVSNDGNDALGAATYTAYRSLLDALQVTGYPHLLRIWNSIPGINVDDGGLERYRRFNLHRYKAYTESKRRRQHARSAAMAGRWCFIAWRPKRRRSPSKTRARPVRTATRNNTAHGHRVFRVPHCGAAPAAITTSYLSPAPRASLVIKRCTTAMSWPRRTKR
jgi:hypothetical protein